MRGGARTVSLLGPSRERSGLPCACPLPQTYPRPPSPWRPLESRLAGPGRGTNGWGRCALGEKAFSSDPRGCLGVPEPPSCRPSSARSGHRCGVTTVACWAEPPLREGSAGPAVGPSAALCLPRPAPPPSESGEDPAGPGRRPARGAPACVRVRVRPLPRGAVSPEGWGAPARPASPCRASGCLPPAPVPSCRRGWRAGTGRAALAWGLLPLGRDSGMDQTDGRRFCWAPAAGVTWGFWVPAVVGPGSRGGGPPRVLRPAGVPGVAGPLSCWWRWDPVHVYPVARFASSLARALPPNHSPHALPALARSAPPPRHRRPTPSVPASTRWLKARRAPDPPSWDRNRPRRCWVLSPPQPLRLWGGGRPRAKCSRPLVRRVSGRAGCRGVGVAARAGERSGGRS